VFRHNLLAIYAVHRNLALQKCVELSHSKNGKEMDSMDDLLIGFEEHLSETNLSNRELFSWRECHNFLCKLLNNQLVPGDKLLRGIQTLIENIPQVSHASFISRMLQESKSAIENHGFAVKDLSHSIDWLTQTIKHISCYSQD
jgi:hypothetical protein